MAPSVEARCAWLTRAAQQLVPLIEQAGLQVPPVKLELDRILTRRRGACYMAMDGVNRIVISPCYVDCLDVLDTLAHELLHAVDNNASGHREAFQRNATKIGFIPRGAGSLQRGPTLEGTLKEIHAGLGPYPQFAAKFVV